MYTILGAGLAGLSVADHLRKKGLPFEIIEGKSHGGGHIHSEVVDGFTWDEGPHVSFTSHQYVKDYFAANCNNMFLEYATKPTNYYNGSWVPHPAQSNMYAVPEPLRAACINDVKVVRAAFPVGYEACNYGDWIKYAFGNTFADNFPAAYTRKYWTTEAGNLTTDWIGKRIYFPEITDMVDSARGPLTKQTHYISKVRYPQRGGYYSYIKNVELSLPVRYNKLLKHISFEKRELQFEDGESTRFEKLISTLPLPMLLLNSDAPENIKDAARRLKCSTVLIINVVVNHPPAVDNHWIYVYDEGFYATRINFTDLLSPGNGVEGKSGIQVEVYFSEYHPLTDPVAQIAAKVLEELVTMNLIKSQADIQSHHTKLIEWANVIFDQDKQQAQQEILSFLQTKGLAREADDLQPMTDWKHKESIKLGDIVLAGRFAQWKYYWTDDCVMRGRYIAEML
jgi:protoporphyrinogen oxidase